MPETFRADALQAPADSDDQADKDSFPQKRKKITVDTLLTQILHGDKWTIRYENVEQNTKNKTWAADE